jgi:hypothetical protein
LSFFQFKLSGTRVIGPLAFPFRGFDFAGSSSGFTATEATGWDAKAASLDAS